MPGIPGFVNYLEEEKPEAVPTGKYGGIPGFVDYLGKPEETQTETAVQVESQPSPEAVPVSKPSYWQAAKTGFKEGLAGAMRMYEIPSRPILERVMGIPKEAFASELLKPTEAEVKNIQELGVPGEVVSGVAGLPGAFAKYGPLMAIAPAGVVGSAATFAGEKTAEELSTGRVPTPIEIGKEAVMGGIFGAIGPLGRLAKAAILGGAFSTQAFGETYAQTHDIGQALHAAIAPGIIGAGLGITGGKKEGEVAKPEITKQAERFKTKAEYEKWRDESLKEISKNTGGLAPEEVKTISNVMDRIVNEPTKNIPQEAVPIEELTKQIQPLTAKTEIQEQVEKPTVPPAEAKITPPPEPAPETILKPEEPKIPKVAGLEYNGIQKIPGQPDQFVFTDLQTESTFYTTDLSKKGLISERDRVRAKFEAEGKKPLPAEQLRYFNEIKELRGYVETGEPGKRIGLETGETAAWGSTYPNFMKNKGWTKVQVLGAIDKGIAGQKLGSRQQEIWDTVKGEARGIFKDRIGEQKQAKIEAIPTGDLEVGDRVKVKDEVLTVTEKNADQIIIKDGQEYKLDPFFDKIEGRKIEGKKPAEAVPIEGTTVPETVTPELSPVEKDQYKLPGMKIGVTEKAPIGRAPTLEGTPLMEAAVKAQIEKVQPKLPIQEKVTPTKEPWEMTREEFKTLINNPDAKSSVRFGPEWDQYQEVQRLFGKKTGQDILSGFEKYGKDFERREVIKNALTEGKPVPPEVLRDYPDLRKPVEKVEAKPAQELQIPTGETVMGRTEKGKFVEGVVNEVEGNNVSVGLPNGDMAIIPRENILTIGKEPTGKMMLKVAQPAPVFYSPLRRIVEEKMGNSMPINQLQALLKQPGIKADELKWSGLDEFLSKKEGKVTKEEILNHLDQNKIEVKEILKGGEFYGQREYGEPKFSQWQLPGGENYRELLLTLPPYTKGESFRVGGKEVGRTQEYDLSKEYRSPHWEEPNVLAHVRFNDRVDAQGKKVLFLEEVQSDWHQAGREKGYVGDKINYQLKQLNKDTWVWVDEKGNEVSPTYVDKESATRFGYEKIQSRQVPSAPFSKTWHEMVMRRMVRWAAENGYDKVAWTTGEQQAARYDLSKQIDGITYVQDKKTGEFQITPMKNEKDVFTKYAKPEALGDLVGKEIAQRIKDGIGLEIDNEYERSGIIKGIDLVIGGEGMKGFYDKIIPEYMNKFGKKWGAKVEETEVRTPTTISHTWRPETGTIAIESDQKAKVHSLDITPSMKESVIREGVALFKVAHPGLLPAVMLDGELMVGSRTHAGIVSDQVLSEAKDVKIGWVDKEGNFTENADASSFIKGAEPGERQQALKAIESKLQVEQEQILTKPELDELTQKVQKLFPPNTKLGFVDELWINADEPQFQQSLGDWLKTGKLNAPIRGQVRVAGRTQQWETTGMGLVSMVDVATKGFAKPEIEDTLRHEAVEASFGFFKKTDQSILLHKYGNRESIAIEITDIAMGKKEAPTSTIRRIVQNVKDFFESLGNYLNGLGYRSARDVVGDYLAQQLDYQIRQSKVEGLRNQIARGIKVEGLLPKKMEPEVAERLGYGQEQLKIVLPKEEKRVEDMISRDIPDRGSLTERIRDVANHAYNNWVNQWHLLGKTAEQMMEGKPSTRAESALASIRLATFRAYGMATTFLEKGIPIKEQREGKLKGDLKLESESLTSIFSDISKNPNKLHAWERYAISLRAIEKEEQGFHTGIDQKDAQFVVDKYDKEFRPLFDRAKKFQDSLFDYYSENMLTPELRDKIKASNLLYVPFYRAIEGTQAGMGKGLEPSQALKRMKGYKEGEVAAKIVDPIESMVKNIYLMVSNAEKNTALLDFVNFARKAPQGINFVRELKPGEEGYPIHSHQVSLSEMKKNEFFKQMVEEAGVTNKELKDEMVNIFRPFLPRGREDMITVYEGGKRKFFEVDTTIGRALQGMDKDSVNQIVKILSYPTKALRAGAVLAPEFMVRNPARDWFSAMVYAKHGFNPFNFFEGLIEGVGKTDLYYKWLMSGGSQASFVSLDRTDLQKTATELLAKKRMAGVLTGNDYKEVMANLVKNPIEALRVVSELGEMGTRLGVFERALEKEPEGYRGSQKAAMASREATIDFGRIGAKAKAVNQLIAFWNANVQGLDKLVRELDFRTPAGRENAMRVATRAALTITLPSLLLAWANKDDERIKQIPEWQKTLFWLVPTKNHVFRIPKPFELGIIFGTVPEKIMEFLGTHDPETFNKIGKAITTGSMPGLIPTAALPFVENWANKSMFTGRPIVPRGKENLLPEYQYQSYTTETAKKIGGLISRLPLIGDTGMASPAKVENFIRGWSGGLGNLALKTADKGLKMSGVEPAEIKPSGTWADIPGLRAFVVRYPASDAQSIQEFYDKAEEASQLHSTITRLVKEGRADEAGRLIEKNRYLSAIHPMFNKTKNVMSNLHQLIDKVYANPNMEPDEKRNLIDEITLRMIAISKQQMDIIKESQ